MTELIENRNEIKMFILTKWQRDPIRFHYAVQRAEENRFGSVVIVSGSAGGLTDVWSRARNGQLVGCDLTYMLLLIVSTVEYIFTVNAVYPILNASFSHLWRHFTTTFHVSPFLLYLRFILLSLPYFFLFIIIIIPLLRGLTTKCEIYFKVITYI